MAGNPFRKSRPAGSVPPDDVPTTPPIQTPTTKKKVKIQSPVEEIPRRSSAGRVSPPPPPRQFDDDDDSDSTATADEDIEEASLNTRRNSGSLPPTNTPAPSGTGAPFNPFARTLATSEASFGLHQAISEQQNAVGQDGQGQARPAMDVDQFKNILMTGNAAPSATTTQKLPDSNSSTDASSASRQSLFDHGLDYHQESPRTSFDQMESASSEDEASYDDEGSNLMSGAGRLDDLAPPAPPKNILGKPSGIKGPQTVSFADFDETIPSSPSQPTMHSSLANLASDNKSRPLMQPRSPSDLNKPLPPPPQSFQSSGQSSETVPDSHEPSAEQSKSSSSIKTAEDSPQQKKIPPPPPPTSRRGGQSGRERSGSGSNTTQTTSYEDEDISQSKPTDPSSKSSAPPPPPARKTRPLSQNVAQPIETPPDAPPSADSKPMPPPPPRRNQSKTGKVPNRSPSNATRTNTSQALPSQTAAAPVPPPPRRAGGSKRESFDARRSSGNEIRSSFESERSHLQQGEAVVSPAASTSSKDILADMTAFQAEIDALRAKHENGG